MEQDPIFDQPKSGAEIAFILLDNGIDQEICSDIALMDFTDAIRESYSVLMNAGKNADAILAPYMEEPDL